MEHSRVKDPADLKRDRSHAQEHEPAENAPAMGESIGGSGATAHGANGSLPNGASEANGRIQEAVHALDKDGAPPELDQSWREGPFNKPLGLMMERVAQQCYTDLNKVVSELAETPVRREPHLVNGAATVTRDSTEASLEKKRKLMEFASDQRERFVKTLVLSDWSRRADSMARLIDIRAWQNKQNVAHVEATRGVGQAKLNMIAAKMPNPNIEGAMEVMSTGKASWISDLGYIPSKPLNAKQLLETLRTMNNALATRINLHEELPPHFRDYTIADGRATFRVRNEFEVDLSLADEETSSPYYFIDLRFASKKGAGSLPDDIRPHLEGRVNAALAENGLRGCYDLLHNFVVTHKINLLRSQAHSMIATRWFDCLHVENMRRSIVLQYWSDLNGLKSWVEIGVSSGRSKTSSALDKARETSAISLRWFRKGVEIKGALSDIDMSEPDIDLEDVVRQIVARHCSWSLRSIAETMSSKPDAALLSMELSESEQDPADCSLSMSLPSIRRELRVHIEPITGLFALSPSSALTERCEERMNKSQDSNIPQRLSALLCSIIQDQVSKAATLLSWQPTRGLIWQHSPQTIFGEGFQQSSIYSCSEDWGSNWALAVTFSLKGERWFIVRLVEAEAQKGRIVNSANPISHGKPLSASPEALLQLQRLAEAEVSTKILHRELNEQGIPRLTGREAGTPEEIRVSNENGVEESAVNTYVSFALLMRFKKNEGWRPWATDFTKISHHGLLSDENRGRDSAARVLYTVLVLARPGSLCLTQKVFRSVKDKDISINPHGAISLKFYPGFGEPLLDQLRARIRKLEDLEACFKVIHRCHWQVSNVSLSHINIDYSKSPRLSAHLTLPDEQAATPHMRLKLHPSASNPHQRIKTMLEQQLNGSPSSSSLPNFFSTLAWSLPCLKALDKLETPALNPTIFARSAVFYSIRYRSPMPTSGFLVRFRTRNENGQKKCEWSIEPNNTDGGPQSEEASLSSMPEGLKQGLDALWKERGEGWMGMGRSAVASPAAVMDVLEKIDGLVRQFVGIVADVATEDGHTTAEKVKTEVEGMKLPDTAKSAPQGQKPQPQQAPAFQQQQQQQQQQKPKPEPTKAPPAGAKKQAPQQQQNQQQQQQRPDVITLD